MPSVLLKTVLPNELATRNSGEDRMVFWCEAGPLKVGTFNNNINKRPHNLVAWLTRAQPDVVCLQELKAEQQAFPTRPRGRDKGRGDYVPME